LLVEILSFFVLGVAKELSVPLEKLGVDLKEFVLKTDFRTLASIRGHERLEDLGGEQK
jgi:hypothetical protein